MRKLNTLAINFCFFAHVPSSRQFYSLFRWQSRCGHSLAFALTPNQQSLRPTAQSMKATGGISLASNTTGRTVQVGCLSKSSGFSLSLCFSLTRYFFSAVRLPIHLKTTHVCLRYKRMYAYYGRVGKNVDKFQW